MDSIRGTTGMHIFHHINVWRTLELHIVWSCVITMKIRGIPEIHTYNTKLPKYKIKNHSHIIILIKHYHPSQSIIIYTPLPLLSLTF